ncbi:MAG: carbohydrate kinase family protein [Christensenellaceae bacterium]|jgi:sugar/nucleoside kinase (ribokinase family)|nr:carbohydrate kinase family protein [Christensenellaceae bacterium]
MSGFIAGSGICNIDLIFSGLEKLPDEGTEIYSKNFEMRLGGGAVGSIITLSKLGIPTKLLTYQASDIFSNFAINEIKKSGLIPIDLRGSSAFNTNISISLVTSNDRTFISYGQKIRKGSDSEEILYENCKGAFAVIMEIGLYHDVYSKLKSEGTKLLLDIGYDSNASITKYIRELELADVFLPNRSEAIKMTRENDFIKAGYVLNKIVPLVIITADKDGAYIFQNARVKHIPPSTDYQYVDATGAGDAFLSGFAYGLYNNFDINTSVFIANMLGAKCVSMYGCLSTNVDENDLKLEINRAKR